MFDITSQDIALLNDADFRELIARLCQAEAEKAGLSKTIVTWGGTQTSKDGGIDVRVQPNDQSLKLLGSLSTPIGIQVKKESMPPAKVTSEMRPKGQLRESISELLQQGGIYVIASSGDNCSDSALKEREDAMKAALAQDNTLPQNVKFLDASQVASWVKDHPSVIPWVRNKIGKPISGWLNWSAWANPHLDADASYYIDDIERVTRINSKETALTTLAALEEIRQKLNTVSSPVRLVGLSGVGKTRFVQALFDEKVGTNPLSSSLAIYTNLSDSPNPQPQELARQLIESHTKAILIVDNCNPELHRELSKICSQLGSKLSLLTVEYDVRDDVPENTDVYKLAPLSDEVTSQVISQIFPGLPEVTRVTILNFSGGNARLALLLASKVKNGEDISKLSDKDLLKRLFDQTNAPNENLLRSAEALSLVYSFNGTDTDLISGEDISPATSELATLSKLSAQSLDDLFRNVNTLCNRDVIQKRGPWRALLPHALANKLAEQALENILPAKIEDFIANASPRLLKSFTRRLGYLSSSNARGIAKKILTSVVVIDDENIQLIKNLAPLIQSDVLDFIQATIKGASQEEAKALLKLMGTVRRIAYKPESFDKAVRIILEFAKRNDLKERSESNPRDALKSLFYLHLSGTHAPLEQRLAFIKPLLESDDEEDNSLACVLLDAIFECAHFSSSHGFDFGGDARDYGYQPKTWADTEQWFKSALDFIRPYTLLKDDKGKKVRKEVAQALRGLWLRIGLFKSLEELLKEVNNTLYWPESWIVLRDVIRDADDLSPEEMEELKALEKILRPQAFINQIRAFVLDMDVHTFDLDGVDDDISGGGAEAYRKGDMTAYKLGLKLAKSPETQDIIFKEVQGSGVTPRVFDLGRGLANGEEDNAQLWARILASLVSVEPHKREVRLICGFLNACYKIDPKMAEEFIQEFSQHSELGSLYPIVQTAVPIDDAAMERLISAVEKDKSPVHYFRQLMYGRALDNVSAPLVDLLIESLLSKGKPGWDVALDVLHMRAHSDAEKGLTVEENPHIQQAALRIIASWELEKLDNRSSYEFEQLIKYSLRGSGKEESVEIMVARIKEAMEKRVFYPWDIQGVIAGLFEAQPLVMLNSIFNAQEMSTSWGRQFIRESRAGLGNPIKSIPTDTLLAWASLEPESRYVILSGVVGLWHHEEGKKTKLSDAARRLLQAAPQNKKADILQSFVARVGPSSWSGSRVPIMEARLEALNEVRQYLSHEVITSFDAQIVELRKDIEAERERELRDSKRKNESFE